MTNRIGLIVGGLAIAAVASVATLWTVSASAPDDDDAQAVADVNGENEKDGSALGRVSDWFQKPETITATIPAGTTLDTELALAIDSEAMRIGDPVEATVVDELRDGNRVVADAGSRLTGRVIALDDSNRVKGRAQMTIRFDRLETVAGPRDVVTRPLTFRAEGSKKKDAAMIGGAAAVGAILGAIVDGGDGAAKGAAIGGVGGTGVVLATRGEDIDLPVGQRLGVILAEPLAVEVEVRE